MKKSLISLGILTTIFVVGLVLAGVVVSKYNDQAALGNRYEMKLKDNSSEFDNTWKKISQVCQLADSKKDAFKEIYVGYADARTSDGAGRVMNWIKEAAPSLDLKVYDNAQNIIVGSRDAWTMRQKELVGIAEQYNYNLSVFPGNLILKMFGFKKIDPKVITSTRTEKAFESGKDDDVDLYKKQK